jgi:hypothetical protein
MDKGDLEACTGGCPGRRLPEALMGNKALQGYLPNLIMSLVISGTAYNESILGSTLS